QHHQGDGGRRHARGDGVRAAAGWRHRGHAHRVRASARGDAAGPLRGHDAAAGDGHSPGAVRRGLSHVHADGATGLRHSSPARGVRADRDSRARDPAVRGLLGERVVVGRHEPVDVLPRRARRHADGVLDRFQQRHAAHVARRGRARAEAAVAREPVRAHGGFDREPERHRAVRGRDRAVPRPVLRRGADARAAGHRGVHLHSRRHRHGRRARGLAAGGGDDPGDGRDPGRGNRHDPRRRPAARHVPHDAQRDRRPRGRGRGLTRRGAPAAAPSAARAVKPAAFGALVVGGGVHGLATAWQLALRGVERVALVERFRLHHDRGSSHGFGRITRTTYSDERYVSLTRVAHAEDWPRLERASERMLIHRCDGVFFGPPEGDLERWAAAVAAAGAPGVERLDAREARRRFPAFAFPDAPFALHDTTGGVVAAADTLLALDRRCRVEGVHVLEETRVLAIDPSADPVVVDTDRGRLLAERVVVTAGAWVARLIPAMRGAVQVSRQHIGYFDVGAAGEFGRFPNWVYVGDEARGLYYG